MVGLGCGRLGQAVGICSVNWDFHTTQILRVTQGVGWDVGLGRKKLWTRGRVGGRRSRELRKAGRGVI